MEHNIIVSMENVSKSFGSECVLRNVSCTFEAGKIHGIIGKNGSGKTILMKLICGLTLPTSGEVRVRGQRIGKDVDVPPDIGALIDAPGFLSYHSGRKNLRYLAQLNRKINDDGVRAAMERVGLDYTSKKLVGKYSLGMRQRLGIAQAIMENPEILLLDEPMNGMDKQGSENIRQLILELRAEGKTIFLASHIPQDIDILCDTVHEIDAGCLMVLSTFMRKNISVSYEVG